MGAVPPSSAVISGLMMHLVDDALCHRRFASEQASEDDQAKQRHPFGSAH
jgi:hypothetical protein